MRQFKKEIFSLLFLAGTLLVGFQNCGDTNFAATPQIVDAACNVASGCASAASTATPSNPTNTQTATNTPNNTSSVTWPVSQVTATPNLLTPPSGLYNFVAGDRATCEASIVNRLGVTAACSIGGGCGVSCGMPGAHCPSANPTQWGLCIAK